MRNRLTNGTLLVGTIGIVVASLILAVISRKPDAAPERPPDITPVESALKCLDDTLSSGESLYTSLVSNGLNATRVVPVLGALGREVNLRSCNPGDSYSVSIDEAGAIVSLLYRKGLKDLFNVRLDSCDYIVTRDEIPFIGAMRRVEGAVETCLWDTFLDMEEDPRIALKLADVFAWEIDFVTDPRAGDTFVIIFEEWYCQGRKVEIGDVVCARYVNRGEEHLAFRFEDGAGGVGYYDYDGNSVKRVFLKSPLSYRRISSYFSHRRFHPILKIYRPHYGVDYAAPTGTPVVSIGDGVVAYAGWKGGLGKYVEIRHNNVYSSCYGHFSRYGSGIRRGVRVTQGQVVGYVGATGLATGPHLDFRVKKFGSYVNPLRIEYPRVEPVSEERKGEFSATRDDLLEALRSSEVAAAVPPE